MKKFSAELIGTFVLTFFFFVTAVVAKCSTDNYAGYLITALAFGLAIVAMAYSIGNISGCHINPAVSLAMLLNGKMTGKEFIQYVIAQVIGGIAAGASLAAILGAETGIGTNALYNNSIGSSILIEAILTAVFVLAVLGATSKMENGAVAGIVIGLSLVFVHILGIAFTGTSVNPARSIGPAIFAGGDALKNVWVFIAGPFIGSIVAALYWKFVNRQEEKK